jgi:DNA-binding SARP family transcriptional activator/tetratricopeptide (TPR) repeat protein
MARLREVAAITAGFRLLGAVEARVDGQLVNLGHARQQCVLVVLLLEANKLLSADQLLSRVWGADFPHRGRDTLYSYLSRLRRALALATDVRIVRRSGNYVLKVDPMTVDVHRFHHRAGQARSADDDHALALMNDALGLWQGEAFAGLNTPWLNEVRGTLEQQRLALEMDRTDLLLRRGRQGELLAGLSASAAAYPWDERLAGQLMLALALAGRQADALAHYRRLRTRLAEDLGTDPGATLQQLHHRILTADSTLMSSTNTSTTPTGPSTPIPRQLPAEPRLFTGRKGQLAKLTATVNTSSEHGGMMVISAIGGTGGIGKTWLALSWAYHNLDRFPDGQLFADLRGFNPTNQPTHPADVLGGFLDALGIDRDRQPNDLDRRAELYRSVVADKRMLVILDNAVSTEQVTPLLPGGRHCTVVITSRNQLRGLTARHGAQPLHLDVLTDPEAHSLLATALGPDRATTDADAIADLVNLCGGFPLALGVIAARAAANPHLLLADIATELRALGVDALDSDDPTASLPSVLSWSLHRLTPHQCEGFTLLGIAPGPDIGLPAATALTGLPERQTHTLLQVLADASLISRTPGGRYAMHDLVRAYATTTANHLPTDVRETALRRVLDFYIHTAHIAGQLLNPHHDPPPLDAPSSDVNSHPLPDAAAALTWFDTEHAGLLAAQHTAITHHWYPAIWWLAWTLDTFHHWQGHRHDRLSVWQAAADAAAHIPDTAAVTSAYRRLGYAHGSLSQHDDALDHLQHALTFAENHHDPPERARIHYALAWAWERRGDCNQALNHARRALDLFRRLDDRVWEARALNNVGWCAARLGDYDTAREHCHAALTLHRHHRDPDGEADSLDSLGYIAHCTGHHTQATIHFQNALALFRDLGNSHEAADTLERIGHPHVALGQPEQARAVWQEALQMYQEQGRHDDATRIQHHLVNLENLDNAPPASNSA